MVMLLVLVYATSATNYAVGGESGWALDSDVQTWGSSYSFSVGDTLLFVYKPVHNVLEVTEYSYDVCNLENPISITDGTNTTVTLDALGTRYFICGTIGHCISGLKVKIVVNSTDSSGSGDGSYTPPIGSSPPSPSQSPPPPSNTPGTPDSFDVPPGPNAPHPKGFPSAATKFTHQFILASVITLVSIKLMIGNY
ncbi:mavicyanin-like [Papaver somniferum]|uniref:mavicyanin-like n=1 Tax=Papaver somniferum TaxID=3469 RepID=UPI000E6F7521|nr:mavicyanin-like [Papaver somniferum]